MKYKSETLKTLNKITNNFNAQVVTWNNLSDAIDNNISFNIIVNTDKYISKKERSLLIDKITFL